jgi:hypothetical protein
MMLAVREINGKLGHLILKIVRGFGVVGGHRLMRTNSQRYHILGSNIGL